LSAPYPFDHVDAGRDARAVYQEKKSFGASSGGSGRSFVKRVSRRNAAGTR
jgi:hypothetical protein